MTLYLRRASRLSNPDPKRVTIVEGDVLDPPTLEAATKGQDVAYVRGHEVSLNSVSCLIVKLAATPGMEIRRSLGVSRG